ncbi:MAG: glycosyltransferase family 1 protein [Anaerolineae bacterium]
MGFRAGGRHGATAQELRAFDPRVGGAAEPLHRTRLVIAGGKGWLDAPIYRAVKELRIEGRVIFTGFLDDALLPALYKTARCLAFPSLYEGFGLPILEAMASGTPVITTGISSMAEVAGDAALLIDPLSIEELRGALITALGNDQARSRLIAAGLQQVETVHMGERGAAVEGVYQGLLGNNC